VETGHLLCQNGRGTWDAPLLFTKEEYANGVCGKEARVVKIRLVRA
jgi:hypothetical protein